MSDHANVIRGVPTVLTEGRRRELEEERVQALEARIEELEVRDKMRDDGERHLLGEVEARDARIKELEAVLTALAPFVRWIEEHYPRAIREMPSHVFQGVDTVRAALGGGSANVYVCDCPEPCPSYPHCPRGTHRPFGGGS